MKGKNTEFSRRDFLTKSTLGLASAGIIGVSGGKFDTFHPVRSKEIIYRTLGKTGLRMPIVNMGVMNADNPEIVKQAYEDGVRLFDTASIYQGGRNEEMIGRYVKNQGNDYTKLHEDRQLALF